MLLFIGVPNIHLQSLLMQVADEAWVLVLADLEALFETRLQHVLKILLDWGCRVDQIILLAVFQGQFIFIVNLNLSCLTIFKSEKFENEEKSLSDLTLWLCWSLHRHEFHAEDRLFEAIIALNFQIYQLLILRQF